jgi:sulfur-carrier protein adenylyltransferase/sulfurtransferase
MRWAMQDWGRTQLLNSLGGTGSAALEMDYVPILSSAAAFMLRFSTIAQGRRETANLLEAGARIQRFWLTAAHLGLALQPALAVLIFAHYGEHEPAFTKDPAVSDKAKRLAQRFRDVFRAGTEDFVFMGRIGEPLPRIGVCRSVRRPVSELMFTPS